MRMMRMAAAVAVAALVPLGLAACSSSGSGTSSGTVKLTVQDYFTAPKPAIDPIYQSCAADGKVSITISHVPGASYITKVLQQSSSHTLPEVLMLDNPDVQQFASTGVLAPLEDYGMTGSGEADGVLAASTYKGKLYGLQPVANSLALFYNTDLFKAANLNPPTTWAELAADAKALTAPGRYGFAFSGINTYEGTWQFMPYMWTNGGSEKDLNSSENTQALQFLTDLVKSGSASKSVVGWNQGDVNNQFIAGKAAMMENGPWNIPALKAATKLHWASVPIPPRDASQTSQAPLGGEAYTVPLNKDKAKMAAAAKFVACLNSDKNQKANAVANMEVPSNKALASEFAAANPDLASIVTIVGNGRARTALLGPDWPAAATKIYTAEQLALTGKATPADAFTQAASQ
ncbi:sugar ABC transporter substrate-binding protein [Diaminobutyricibacter tongyongensis]|uniref:Sugar ABC transporter substrate-binding protein n=1 Tax=Leifsonia tongyongensis TaxID=1268043 RepID=A0A6L9XW18_9MICO|nr:sugar ABC transporter substrate-binding protein [Diaminobutyricibacter tongyongensis]NEN05417.1 sugar ABC transporter substrate-binding protein [Diaminobutyricibacter tongyongensis]